LLEFAAFDDAEKNAVGLLHEELRRCGSLVMAAADRTRIPGGSALVVDRTAFAAAIEAALAAEPLVEIRREEAWDLPPRGCDAAIVATGPLTSPALAEAIAALTGTEALAFFDAIAPIVYRETIDFDKAWFQSRYDKSGADYVNCPLDCEEYQHLVAELLAADKIDFHEWKKTTPYFEGCLPIEVMAARGPETLRYGPMKPVGLRDPRSGRPPHAVVQLRQDNAWGTLYNLVGFQTKLRHGEQKRVFRMIPGLERAEFARFGGLHRNTFLNSPRLLDRELRLKTLPQLRFAGQITGVEGYVESAAIGLLAGCFGAAEQQGGAVVPPPPTTALGALAAYVTGSADARSFQPMNANFGLFPPLQQQSGRSTDRKALLIRRARADLGSWLSAS
jgi:methylenetetrahydrofolate--tRNA-(uracil-5-)-methyltransferase